MKDGKKYTDIRDRCFQYSLRSITVVEALSETKNPAANIIGRQFLRSATSIGANIEEAQSGESRSDFIHKYSIAQKEARESLYWLRLLEGSGIVSGNRLEPLIKETDEIISVITTIIVRSKKNGKI